MHFVVARRESLHIYHSLSSSRTKTQKKAQTFDAIAAMACAILPFQARHAGIATMPCGNNNKIVIHTQHTLAHHSLLINEPIIKAFERKQRNWPDRFFIRFLFMSSVHCSLA